MTVMELGALGEFLDVFALVATLIYLSIQMRHARGESEKAVLEARNTGIRELSLSVATSDGLSAALVKADEAIRLVRNPFESELVEHGLDNQEASRVNQFYLATWRHDATQYETATQEQRNDQNGRLRAVYTDGAGRLFWENFPRVQRGTDPFVKHVNQLIAEADQQQETQQ